MVRTFLRRSAVKKATGWSDSTLYRKVREGKFPPPIKLDPDGQTSGWFEDEVEAFQKAAVAAAKAA